MASNDATEATQKDNLKSLKEIHAKLLEQKVQCSERLGKEIDELVKILLDRKQKLLTEADEIFTQMSKEITDLIDNFDPINSSSDSKLTQLQNFSPHVAFTFNSEIRDQLRTFGELYRKSFLQTKSPTPLTLLPPHSDPNVPLPTTLNQYHPYITRTPAPIHSTSIPFDKIVKDSHPDPREEIKIKSIPATFRPLCMTQNDDSLYIISQDEKMYIINAQSGSLINTIAVVFSHFFPAISVGPKYIYFGNSSDFEGKIWIYSLNGTLIKEKSEFDNYGKLILLSDIHYDANNETVLLVDTNNNSLIAVDEDLESVTHIFGRQINLYAPTRVCVNSRNLIYVLHNRGSVVSIFTYKEEFMNTYVFSNFNLFSEFIRFSPHLSVTDNYIIITFDNIIYVYNIKSRVLSVVKLNEICGVLPKCIFTNEQHFLLARYDALFIYNMNYFD